MCTQCCGCKDEIAGTEATEAENRLKHPNSRCRNVFNNMTDVSDWLYLTMEAKVDKLTISDAIRRTNNGVNEKNT